MRRRTAFLVWGGILFGLSFVFMVFFVNPVVAGAARVKIETLTARSVNRAISSIVTLGTYREITQISYDSNGKISGISTNMMQANGLATDIAAASQNFLDSYAREGISVPLGTFSGLPILSGRGPNVNLRIVPVGAVHCTFDSEFLGQGINQTLHRLTLKVKVLVNLIMPLGSRNIEAEIEALLCESIIVGEVPEFLFTK